MLRAELVRKKALLKLARREAQDVLEQQSQQHTKAVQDYAAIASDASASVSTSQLRYQAVLTELEHAKQRLDEHAENSRALRTEIDSYKLVAAELEEAKIRLEEHAERAATQSAALSAALRPEGARGGGSAQLIAAEAKIAELEGALAASLGAADKALASHVAAHAACVAASGAARAADAVATESGAKEGVSVRPPEASGEGFLARCVTPSPPSTYTPPLTQCPACSRLAHTSFPSFPFVLPSPTLLLFRSPPPPTARRRCTWGC